MCGSNSRGHEEDRGPGEVLRAAAAAAECTSASLFLDHVVFFWFFGSAHFYWGSAKNSQFFATKE